MFSKNEKLSESEISSEMGRKETNTAVPEGPLQQGQKNEDDKNREPIESGMSETDQTDGHELGTEIKPQLFENKVIEAISTVFDPEIPVNIYELGLIYNIDINGMKDVHIDMTLTSPACPVAGSLPGDVERAVKEVEEIGGVSVELVWEPAWSPDRMSEAAKLELGFM